MNHKLTMLLLLVSSPVVRSNTCFARHASLPISPDEVITYPGYETVFKAHAPSTEAGVTWFLAGQGSISDNRFVATTVGRATIMARTEAATFRVPITIQNPTSIGTDLVVADFETRVPTANASTSGLWQIFNPGGTYKRIVANPQPDEINPTAMCAELDRSAAFASHGFAFKDGIRLTGQFQSFEVAIFGNDLTSVGWIVGLNDDLKSKSGHKSTVKQWDINVKPGVWNKIVVPLDQLTGVYLSYIAFYPNRASTNPGVFFVDQARLVQR